MFSFSIQISIAIIPSSLLPECLQTLEGSFKTSKKKNKNHTSIFILLKEKKRNNTM